MNRKLKNLFGFRAKTKTTIVLLSVVFFFVSAASTVSAQKKFSRTYPASRNVRLTLTNRMGTVTVEGWERPEVSIIADLDTPTANIEPQSLSGTIVINLVKDNQGRNDVGSVNFRIRVPFTSSVDIETVMGNLSVSNVRGAFVRAHITTEGDITLTNISAGAVSAENVRGDIFFDGNLQSDGSYRFASTSSNIALRIPFESSFRVVATAPSTRNISLGVFSGGMKYGDGRRVTGQFGDGRATLTVTSQRGSISFLRR